MKNSSLLCAVIPVFFIFCATSVKAAPSFCTANGGSALCKNATYSPWFISAQYGGGISTAPDSIINSSVIPQILTLFPDSHQPPAWGQPAMDTHYTITQTDANRTINWGDQTINASDGVMWSGDGTTFLVNEYKQISGSGNWQLNKVIENVNFSRGASCEVGTNMFVEHAAGVTGSNYTPMWGLSSFVTSGAVGTYGTIKTCATSVPKTRGCTGSVGNPCSITSGNKFQPELDWSANKGALRWSRFYNSLESASPDAASPLIGAGWASNFAMKLKLTFDQVALYRDDGKIVYATNLYSDTTLAGSGGWFINRDESLKLTHNTDGTWLVTKVKTNNKETYNSQGVLQRIDYQNGQNILLNYTNGVLTSIIDNFGQSLVLAYDSNNRINKVTLPSGLFITYTYDSLGHLSTVSRPGYGIKTYLYSENSTSAPSGNPNLLTGILDENGKRYANYAYDSQDRGILTEHAGSTQKYTLSHSDTATIVTDPYGTQRNYAKTLVSGSPRIQTVTKAGTTEKQSTYDQAGNITSSTQFGRTTNYVYDLTRNLETSRTEAVGTPQERTITTQWDTNLPLPLLISESGRTTAYTYDAYGNPATKIITDTTTNTSRTWTYTYNSVGQKLTETNPAGQTTTYTYNSNGNLLNVTNAIGHVTTYSDYTSLGQPGKIVYANGHQIIYIYDDAGRVTQTNETVGSDAYQTTDGTNTIQWPQWIIDLVNAFFQLIGQSSPFDNNGATPAVVSQPLTANSARVDTTNYTYDPIGQLTQVVMPSGETLTYTYDDAHRLTGATDSLGNSITYTLNGAGDITKTETLDPTGNIKVQTQQVYDALGHVYQDLGNNSQSTTYTYDNFDNLTSANSSLARNSSSTYDALNHKVTDVDALGYTSTYSYNALDQLLTVKDARNNTTTYTPNAFGENTTETSPDTGLTTRAYSNGQITSVTDSSGIAHTYGYDNLGRVTQRTDGTGTGQMTTQFGYDTGTYDKGSLTSLSNADSSIHYSHDSLGNVIEKDIAIHSTVPLRVQYKYLTGNKVSDIMLPSGHRISYTYTAGKVTSISSGSDTLLSNIKYAPTGIARWNWGTGSDANVFSFDLDGRMTGVSSTGVLGRSYAFDAGNRILTIADILAGIGTQTYIHDKIDRLTQQSLTNLTLTYGYDANSNRTTKTQTPSSGSAVTNTYALQSSTNRINTTTTGTSSPLTSTYLPTGQLVSDGVRTYSYDSAGRSTSIIKDGVIVLNTYDGIGQRVRKSVGNVPIYFVYDENGQLLGEYDQSGNMIREYIWLGNRIVGMYSKDVPNVLLRVHTDHLGTVRAVTQGDGATLQVLWRFEGDAFGDVQPNAVVNNFTMPIRMPGQYYDAEVGTSYNYFRDYDPSTGRYVESDPIGLKGGMNTYGYVGANPLSMTDPMGLLQEAAKRCVCGYMKLHNYDSGMAWTDVLNSRKSYGWNNPTLRPCENYLYAFAAVDSYGDPYWLIGLGVNFHAAQKLIASGTSPWNVEAYLAGLEGVRDAKNHKDWRHECEGNQC